MGILFSRWRKQLSTIDILDSLQKDILSLERQRVRHMESQRRVLGSLILYSALAYVVAAIAVFFYFLPEELSARLLCCLPLIVFPFLIWAVRSLLRWYFVSRIEKNELALSELQLRKETLLDTVMETESYKKAKEILEKYAPEKVATEQKDVTPSKGTSQTGPQASAVRQRSASLTSPRTSKDVNTVHQPSTTTANSDGAAGPVTGMDGTKDPVTLPASLDAVNRSAVIQRGAVRPIMPQDRSVGDRLVEFLLGDGPNNRYALICGTCHSHNGMALREEFEYLAYRCCYCSAYNKARKLRPNAPALPSSSSAGLQLRMLTATDSATGSNRSVTVASYSSPRSKHTTPAISGTQESALTSPSVSASRDVRFRQNANSGKLQITELSPDKVEK